MNRAIEEALSLSESRPIDQMLCRDVTILKTCELPNKPKISSPEGQARLIHDLASIELQAMELALRTLYEFPKAPKQFRIELAALVRSEASHLMLCLKTLETLRFEWGSWPVHIALWQSVSSEDSLIERVFIVHRYLEASGLDAGEAILLRLSGLADKTCYEALKIIVSDEINHVDFGSRWFRKFCDLEGLDPELEFFRLFRVLSKKAPRKEKISSKLRRLAGFSESELKILQTEST